MIGSNQQNPIQNLLHQLQIQNTKQQIEQQNQMLEQERVMEEHQRLNKFYATHKQPQNIKDIQHENSKLITNTLSPVNPTPNIPPPTLPPQQVIPPPPSDYVVAKNMEEYVKLGQDEMNKAYKEGRKPNLDRIKEPGYKPPKIEAPIIEVKRYVNNPNYDPVYQGALLNPTEYNNKMNKSNKTVYDNYSIYRQKWSQRHSFLAPNPQYRKVEYLLEKKQQQQEKTFTVKNSDAYKRGQQMLEATKKEFGKPPPMIKLGRGNTGGGGYSTDI